MMKGLAIILLAGILVAGAASFALPANEKGNDINVPIGHGGMPRLGDEDRARDIGLDFVKADKTYKFDGMEDTLKVSYNRTLDGNVYEIIAEFTSAHGGYGDRTGEMVLQVLTDHRAVIHVKDDKIIYAVMDDQWDMVNDKLLKQY